MPNIFRVITALLLFLGLVACTPSPSPTSASGAAPRVSDIPIPSVRKDLPEFYPENGKVYEVDKRSWNAAYLVPCERNKTCKVPEKGPYAFWKLRKGTGDALIFAEYLLCKKARKQPNFPVRPVVDCVGWAPEYRADQRRLRDKRRR